MYPGKRKKYPAIYYLKSLHVLLCSFPFQEQLWKMGMPFHKSQLYSHNPEGRGQSIVVKTRDWA